jgi:AMP deaminase
VLNFGELLDNVFNPPAAAASRKREADISAEAGQLITFLESVSAIEIAAVSGLCPEILDDECDKEPREWTGHDCPQYAYQCYHSWARLKAMNSCRNNAGLPPLALRCAASNAEPLACGYLLGASGFSRCGALASHVPLQYLFVVDRIYAAVSLCSKRSLGGSGNTGPKGFERMFKAGVPISLCSEDNTESQQCDAPLAAEYQLAASALSLSSADLFEIARHSVDLSGFPSELRGKVPPPKPPEEDDNQNTEAELSGGIRERYREARRAAEQRFLTRLAGKGAQVQSALAASA